MDYQEIESSQRQHFNHLKHHEEMNILFERQEFNLFSIIKPKLYKDGNEWCCLYGENIVEGVVGFGPTPKEAVLKWTEAFKNN